MSPRPVHVLAQRFLTVIRLERYFCSPREQSDLKINEHYVSKIINNVKAIG